MWNKVHLAAQKQKSVIYNASDFKSTPAASAQIQIKMLCGSSLEIQKRASLSLRISFDMSAENGCVESHAFLCKKVSVLSLNSV